MMKNANNSTEISQVVIRFEIDDININSKSLKLHKEESNREDTLFSPDFAFLTYESEFYLNKKSLCKADEEKQIDLIEQFSEKFESKEEALREFIGKRQSQSITVETYKYFERLKDSKLSNMSASANNNNNNNKINHNNAMTMQAALELAYTDWNKDKQPHSKSPQSNPKVSGHEAEKCENVEENERKEEKLEVEKIDQKPVKPSDKQDENRKESVLIAESSSTADLIEANLHKLELSDCNLNNNKKSVTCAPISFFYGNPTVDLIKGFVHIYKDCNLTLLETNNKQDKESTSNKGRSEILCMIGVPSNINSNELIDFLMPFNESIEYMRVIRDMHPNQYMTLIKLKSQEEADKFYLHNNNKPFNSIEESVCHLAFVERIEVVKSSKGASLPIPGFTELPTCYICLERMDESLKGVITILCNHSFHTSCLYKWGNTCCPVCRYSTTPDYTLDSTCSECGSHENLWICLICGHVGCGRYVHGHAYSHFKLTQHTYSMQLGSNRVWDYAADNYVHRLIQNKTDGKLVQFDERSASVNNDEKIDSITLEYTFLLTSQLESQRSYFEERLQMLDERNKSQLHDAESKLGAFQTENEQLKEHINQLSKEKVNLDKKCSTLQTKVSKMQSELEEEKEINKMLRSNQEVYQTKLKTIEETMLLMNKQKDDEIKELKMELRDLMFYLDAPNQMSKETNLSKEELESSTLSIRDTTPAEASSAASSNSKTRRRKKN